MTPNEIFTVARRFLQDTAEPYRWADQELANNLKFALRELNKIRPETRYVNGLLTDGTELPDDFDEEIALEDRYEEALAYYVVYLCYLDDNTDTVNGNLAELYLSKFNTKAQI